MSIESLSLVIGAIVGLVGGLCGILGFLNQRKQTAVMQDQLRAMNEQLITARLQEDNVTQWAKRFDEAVHVLAKVSPEFISKGPSTWVSAYLEVFPDADLRRRIDHYLGTRSTWKWKFRPAAISREQLQNIVVQKTISDVLDQAAKFKTEHTDFARALKLIP